MIQCSVCSHLQFLHFTISFFSCFSFINSFPCHPKITNILDDLYASDASVLKKNDIFVCKAIASSLLVTAKKKKQNAWGSCMKSNFHFLLWHILIICCYKICQPKEGKKEQEMKWSENICTNIWSIKVKKFVSLRQSCHRGNCMIRTKILA